MTGCQDSCADKSYAYTFPTGGKTCRSCFELLGQALNEKECTCPEPKIYYQGNCYLAENLPVKCSSNQILIGGLCYSKDTNITCVANSHSSPDGSICLCDDGYEYFQTQCLKICPENSNRTTFGVCSCRYGYIMNSSKICESICP